MSRIFFIPGLGGDDSIRSQKSYVAKLNKYLKKDIYFFDPCWETQEPAVKKLFRLRQEYENAGRPTTIFGVSAGASAAIILGSETNSFTRLITLAGKHKGSEGIGPVYQERAPALLEFVTLSENILKSDPTVALRLTSYRPLIVDGVVPMKDIRIHKARNRLLLVPFHITAIIAGLAFILPFV